MFKRFYQSGVVLLELTLILPLLLTLIVGVIFISSKLQARAFLANITQEGARILSREAGVTISRKESPEYSKLSNLDSPIIFTAVSLSSPGSAISKAHLRIYNLLKVMKKRDQKFNIRDIYLKTYYVPGEDDKVYVEMQAEVEMLDTFSNSLLYKAGLLSKKAHSVSSQPFLLTLN